MTIRTSLLALSLVAAASVSHATVTFQNDGTKEGWPNYPQKPQAHGTITDISSPVYIGKTGNASAIKFTQTWLSGYTGRYHSEVDYQGTGTDRYYGEAEFLPTSWTYAGDNVCIQQWAGTGPWLMMEIRGQNIVVLPHIASQQQLGTIARGVWTRIVVHLRATGSGAFEAWINGTKKMGLTGNFNPPGTTSVRWSTGCYVTGWTGKTSKPTPSYREIYGDHYRIATTQAEADPINW